MLGKQNYKMAQELQRKREEDSNAEMFPGVDYVVRDPGKDENCLRYPDLPSTKHFRRAWILQRRPRPVAPTMIAAPTPRHRDLEADRSALTTMTYFRPWTLRKEYASVHVPPGSSLKGEHSTWQNALDMCLNGGIISNEPMKYIGSFLSVYRWRPK